MLLAVIVLKGLTEVVLLALISQGVLYLFAGAGRDRNLIYRLFATVTRPVLRAARLVTPRFIVDQHIGLVAFFLTGAIWFALVLAKVHFFLEQARPA